MLDYNLGAEISNQACGTAWLILNDPPIINLPKQGEKLRAQDPQNILFQWTPRHTGSPNSAFNTEYDFQLVELWPDNRDPNHAILSTPPIYEATTFSTSLVYGPAETPLEPGRKYAFRVRAKAMTGIEEMDLFKNGGYSEVYSFTYGDACTAPGVVSATTVSSSRVEVRWESAPFHTEFTVRYREKSKRGAKWQEKRTYASDLVVDGLLPETEYEFQVLGICGSLTGAASETVSMITSEEPATHFTCGAGPDAFDLENQDPLPELKWGDVFKAGDVEVTVLNVKGGNGTFSGTGLAEMPWLRNVKLRVEFSGIFLNTDYQLLRGSVKSVFNPDSKMIVNLDGLDDLFKGKGESEGGEDATEPETDNEIVFEGVIAEVTIDPETGAIVVIDEIGKEVSYPQGTDEKKSVKIVDSQGDVWLVDKNGNVSKGSGNGGETQETVTPGSATDSTHLYITYGKQKYQDKDVIFFPFDTKNKVTLQAVVENDTTQNKTFTWKGVTSSKDDKGTVDLSKSTGKSANKVELTYGGKTIELSLNIVGAYFERLPDGTSGQKNIYGYDEMDKANPDDDHVSVETNGETFVELQTSTKNFKGIFLTSDNDQIAEAVVDGKKIKIIGKNQNKQQTMIRAYTVNDSSTAIAIIAVNVYNKVDVEGKIYNVYLTGKPSTQVTGGISASTIQTEANKYLKYLLVDLYKVNPGVQIPVAYDLNGNGKLDFYKNGKQHELNVVYTALQSKGLLFNDIVRFNDAFTRNWEIMDSVKKGDTYILVKDHPSKPADKGFDLSSTYGEYMLQAPSGAQSETFQIISFKGDTVFITTNSNKSVVKGFSSDHPKTNDLKTSHVIVSKAMTGGASPNEGDPTRQDDDRPALICGNLTSVSIGQRVAHELMHGQDLRDVNDNTNIMHFNTSLNIGDLPFRYKDLTPVVTGTSTPDTTKPKQNQWELIKGR